MAILNKEDAEYIAKYIINKKLIDVIDRDLIDIISILCFEKLTSLELDVMVELYKHPHMNAKYNNLVAKTLDISKGSLYQTLRRLRIKGIMIDKELESVFMTKPLDNKDKIKLLKEEIKNKTEDLKKLEML